MRINEILLWNNNSTEGNRSNPQLDLPPAPFRDDPTNLANAFTRSGLVKHFWNLNGSEGQPYGPAPLDTETEAIDVFAQSYHWSFMQVEYATDLVFRTPARAIAEIW